MDKKIKQKLKKIIITHLENKYDIHLENIIKSLIYRKFALDEEHATIKNDNEWDNFYEWETLQNIMESAQLDYFLDSDDGIHFTKMRLE